MLQSITIQNIALIDKLSITLGSGFNVLTGETGAGKSLIIDSIALILGERADRTLITHGKDFASVEAVFSSVSDETRGVMSDIGLEIDDDLVIFRKVCADGKSEIKANGQTLTVAMLKRLSNTLVDLHGQFENQALLKTSSHLSMLDSFAGLIQEKKQLVQILDEISSIQNKLDDLIEDDDSRARALDVLRFQIDEIEHANFKEGEEETLKASMLEIQNKEKIVSGLSLALEILDGDGGARSRLAQAAASLSQLARFSEENSSLSERLHSAGLEIQDVLETIKNKLEALQEEESNEETIETRLNLLKSFKKKYGETIEKIWEFQSSAKLKMETLENMQENVNKLKTQKAELKRQAENIAEGISAKRQKAAATFEKQIIKELNDLGMKGARFLVEIKRKQEVSKTGFDDVEFLFSANTGMPPRALSKIASGGEMSRFSLAVKNVGAVGSATLIFDEIDTGISGNAGRVVGEKMVAIAKNTQVICVTHLAQIAAFADSHFMISKSENNGFVKSTITLLSEAARAEEIERLSSGSLGSTHAAMNAKEMLQQAKKLKNG